MSAINVNQAEIIARKRMEEALRRERDLLSRVMETSPAAILLLDREGRITFANPRAEQALGIAAEAIAGRTFSDPAWRITDYDGQPIADDQLAYARFLQDGKPLYNLRRAVEWPDGRRTLLSINATPLLDAAGQVECVVATIEDVTSRVHAQRQIEAYQQRLRSLASEAILAEERERRRIATFLHDEIGQTLAIAKMKLGALRDAVSLTGVGGAVDQICGLLDDAIRDTRSLTFELSPPVLYELGLAPALEWLAETVQTSHNLRVTVECEGDTDQAGADIRVLLFQAARELLLNVAKHAQAREARVRLRQADARIEIVVEDRGAGFDVSALGAQSGGDSGFGLFNVRERLAHVGGHAEIVSAPGRGTRVTLSAPLKTAREELP